MAYSTVEDISLAMPSAVLGSKIRYKLIQGRFDSSAPGDGGATSGATSTAAPEASATDRRQFKGLGAEVRGLTDSLIPFFLRKLTYAVASPAWGVSVGDTSTARRYGRGATSRCVEVQCGLRGFVGIRDRMN
eukprot:6179456-Pleurochrysis_carterae.AAC.1